jgi:TPP-dependent pyruvate/acetoin dehydrogenase alpha subunit
MKVSLQDMSELYRWMVYTRMVEEKICELFSQGIVRERQHASIGQEAIGVGVCYGLRRDDKITPSLRTRAAFLVKGVPLRTIMCGLFGSRHGAGKGKNTSHHMGDSELGILAGSGVLGASVPVAVGAGLAAKLREEDWVSIVFYGDGASNRGDVHEAMNFASVYQLPVIFILENNQYAWSTPFRCHSGVERLSMRASGYGIPGYTIDGNDVLTVHEMAKQAIAKARDGKGPTLIECMTYRWRGHSEREAKVRYRPKEEEEEWLGRCPIRRLRNKLMQDGLLDEYAEVELMQCLDQEIRDAVAYAQQDPYPDIDELHEDVFAFKTV